MIDLQEFAETDHPYGNELGQKVCQKLRRFVDKQREYNTFCIDMSNIVTTDASFPRESVVALAKLFVGEKGFFLKGFASQDLLDTWSYTAEKKNIPLVVWNDGLYQFIGKPLSSANSALVDFVYGAGQATTSMVADELKITVQNASTKLKRLVADGYLLRSEETAETGGKEFIYLAIKPSD